MDQDSGDLSDGLDEFEASGEEQLKKKGAQSYVNKPYDEAYEISADLSMAESFDGREAKVCGGCGDGEMKWCSHGLISPLGRGLEELCFGP